LAEIIRTRIAPLILPQVVKLEAAREYIFRTISQITLSYRGKGLDEGPEGASAREKAIRIAYAGRSKKSFRNSSLDVSGFGRMLEPGTAVRAVK